MVRAPAEVSAGRPGDSGAVDGREQPQDVQEDAEELVVETGCREVTLHQYHEDQRKEDEHALVVDYLGVVSAVEVDLSASLTAQAGVSLTRHFSKSASPREKTDGSDRSRFRARAQTAASRAIFASLSAFPAEAAHAIGGWLARW